MDPSERSSKEQRAYEAVKERIINGTYGPGVRLVLDQLARDLQVSAVPIREAIRRLEAEGWVNFRRNVGAHVATVDMTQYRAAMESLALFEGYATAAAVPHLDAATLAEAQRINDRLRESLASFDPLGFTRGNHEFHELICSKCPNDHLRGLLKREWERLNLLRRTTFSLAPGRAAKSVEEHDELLHLIGSTAEQEVIEGFARRHKLNTLIAVAERSLTVRQTSSERKTCGRWPIDHVDGRPHRSTERRTLHGSSAIGRSSTIRTTTAPHRAGNLSRYVDLYRPSHLVITSRRFVLYRVCGPHTGTKRP